MRWDDRIFTGTHGKWWWIVVRDAVRGLGALVAEFHTGQRLCITTFDSGQLVSPPLTPQMHIGFDEQEGYIIRLLPTSIDVSERYGSYFGFNLAEPHALVASQNPTWDRTNYDWLIPLQEKFWSDMERLNPTTYICRNDADIVVTCNAAFFQRVRDIARQVVE